MEHRWGERLKVALPVHIRAACGLIGTGLVDNFSVSGAFIATTLPVALLSQVRVSFPMGRRTARIGRVASSTFEAQVVRKNPAGFAVEWCDFGTDEVVAFANSSRLGVSPAHRRAGVQAAAFAAAKHS